MILQDMNDMYDVSPSGIGILAAIVLFFIIIIANALLNKHTHRDNNDKFYT